MRNFSITVEYDGTNYCGWQVQNKTGGPGKKAGKETIQGVIEQVLAKVLQEKITLIGSGRTDAGVHALGQNANFKTNSRLKPENILSALNSLLPADIRLKGISRVAIDFHSRFSATGKLYRYTIVNQAYISPFLTRYAYLVKPALDIKKMRQAAKYLQGKHDFRSFQATAKKMAGSVRTVKRLEVLSSKEVMYINIEADGFLYRMVRNIVGTLIEVGRCRLKPGAIKTILAAKNRGYAGPCAPAKGLCLICVSYKG